MLPGLAAARGRAGQHGEARDSPGTLDEPTPSDYTAASLSTAVTPCRVKHVESSMPLTKTVRCVHVSKAIISL